MNTSRVESRASERTPRRNKVIVGVDGSEPSKRALQWAALLALATGDDLEAVIVWSLPRNTGWAALPTDWNPEADATTVLDDTVRAVFGEQRPANLTLSVREGYPAKVLLDASRAARALVVGSRGHGGFTGLMLGSVSANCAERAQCPVLVVHGADAPEDDGRADVVREAARPERPVAAAGRS